MNTLFASTRLINGYSIDEAPIGYVWLFYEEDEPIGYDMWDNPIYSHYATETQYEVEKTPDELVLRERHCGMTEGCFWTDWKEVGPITKSDLVRMIIDEAFGIIR